MSERRTYKDLNLANEIVKGAADLLYAIAVGSKQAKIERITHLLDLLKNLRKTVDKDPE